MEEIDFRKKRDKNYTDQITVRVDSELKKRENLLKGSNIHVPNLLRDAIKDAFDRIEKQMKTSG